MAMNMSRQFSSLVLPAGFVGSVAVASIAVSAVGLRPVVLFHLPEMVALLGALSCVMFARYRLDFFGFIRALSLGRHVSPVKRARYFSIAKAGRGLVFVSLLFAILPALFSIAAHFSAGATYAEPRLVGMRFPSTTAQIKIVRAHGVNYVELTSD